MLDVDDFKRVNDIYGHATGDHALVALADILPGTVRVSDVVCRLGGEEFGVIMASCDAGDALGLRPPDRATASPRRVRARRPAHAFRSASHRAPSTR